MSRILSMLLVLGYQLGLVIPVLLLLQRIFHIHYSNLLLFELLVVWLFAQAAGCALDGRFATWSTPIRKLMQKEESILLPLFIDVCQNSGVRRNYKLLLQASNEPSAFAVMPGWIIISKGMLRLLDKEEIKAVFAHEIAHLKSGDCAVIACLNLTECILNMSYPKIRWCFRIAGTFHIIPVLVVLLCLWFKCLLPVSCLVAFVYLIPFYRRAFMFCFLYTMRKREYAADQFAHSLGHGESLLRVLSKLKNSAPALNTMHEITRMTHPIIHHRIISIEKKLTSYRLG